jgi:hypothetical protein
MPLRDTLNSSRARTEGIAVEREGLEGYEGPVKGTDEQWGHDEVQDG